MRFQINVDCLFKLFRQFTIRGGFKFSFIRIFKMTQAILFHRVLFGGRDQNAKIPFVLRALAIELYFPDDFLQGCSI